MKTTWRFSAFPPPDHIRDNFAIFDFTLTKEEMERIAKLDGTKKYYEPDNETEEKYAMMEFAL